MTTQSINRDLQRGLTNTEGSGAVELEVSSGFDEISACFSPDSGIGELVDRGGSEPLVAVSGMGAHARMLA